MTAFGSALGRVWEVLAHLGLARYVRRGYFVGQAAPRGWRYRTRVGDASADLATSTWFEYKRVRTLHGERAVLTRLLDDLRDDDVFWDVGANVGIYSCLVADTLSSGTVVGFEPEPNNRERLRANLDANDPQCDWLVSSLALSDTDVVGRLALDFAEEHRQVGAGHFHLSETDGLPVECRRAATLIDAGYLAPDLVKIDVQGAELDVLRGFGDVLDDVRCLYVELHTEKARRYDATVEQTEQYLRDAGYSLTRLGEPAGARASVYHIRATR